MGAAARAMRLRLLARRTNVNPDGSISAPIGDGVGAVGMVARNRTATTMAAKPTVTMATQRVSQRAFPGGKSVKSRQAWKYPGGSIVRAPTVWLNGNYYTDPKEDPPGEAKHQGKPGVGDTEGVPRRKQESNFFITINNNRSYDARCAPKAQNAYRKALHELNDVRTFARILKFGPKHEHYVNDNPEDVILPGVEFTASVETGDVLKRMHAHIILKIEHYSQIQINVPMLQYEFRRAFNAALPALDPCTQSSPPYVQVKMLPQSDWTTVMHQYVKKGMMGGI